MGFKSTNNFESRCTESNKIIKKYPCRIPIIVEKQSKCQLNDIDKQKFLVPKDLNMNQFIYIIRKRIKLDKSESLFMMVDNQLCPGNTPISSVYEDYKDSDGFLYITYSSENTFG
mgnify:CR=1 FL=1